MAFDVGRVKEDAAAIANPDHPDWIMLAYDQDATTTNGLNEIEVLNEPLALSFFPPPPGLGFIDIPSPDYTLTSSPTFAPGAWSNDDAKLSLYGFMQRRPKLITIDADHSAYPFDRDLPRVYPNLQHWVMCVFESEAYDLYQNPVTIPGGALPAGKYSDMLSTELARPAGIESGYLENNVVARVLRPSLEVLPAFPTQPQLAAKLAVFANTNAQDLYNLTYTDSLGPIVTSIDYTNSANVNGIVRVNSVIPNYFLPPGGMAMGTWIPPTSTSITNPVFINGSWFPMYIHPSVGAAVGPAPLGPPVPSGTWTVNPAWSALTLDPYQPGFFMVDYISPGYTNVLQITGQVDHIPGQWPISLHNNFGQRGNITISQGVGFKPTGGPNTPTDKLDVSLSANPAITSTTAKLRGPLGHAVSVRLLNPLGGEVAQFGSVEIGTGTTSVPIDVTHLASGSYILEATGDEGSHARTFLSVRK